MPTPSKPVSILKMEKKSHRTKKELLQREKAEESLLTGIRMKEKPEVKQNEIAHREFNRIRKMLKTIQKDDELYANIINRYCLLYAECEEFEVKRENLYKKMDDLEDNKAKMEFEDYIKMQIEMSKMILSYDKQIQAKRKMMFDIEKENAMTIAAALRNIPKKTDTKKSALREALSG